MVFSGYLFNLSIQSLIVIRKYSFGQKGAESFLLYYQHHYFVVTDLLVYNKKIKFARRTCVIGVSRRPLDWWLIKTK